MRSKIAAAALAGGLLVGAGLVTSVISSPAAALAQEETDDGGPIPRIIGFLDEVLDDLIGDGTITEEQADAIVAAAEEKAEEVKNDVRERREMVRSLLEDDVLTEEEAADLPNDHWLLSDRFDEGWEDGELTRDEIDDVLPHPISPPFRWGFRLGAPFGDGEGT
jgi:hypothetical protein